MEEKEIYHEKQRLQFFLLHALNNLLQEKDAFTRAELDAIADKLTLDDVNKDKWTPFSFIFKPHHNILTGNYDVNVLIAALEAKGKKVVWHDHRAGASSIKLSDDGLTDGRFINPHRNRLHPNTIEALMCTQDWLKDSCSWSTIQPTCSTFDEKDDENDEEELSCQDVSGSGPSGFSR